LRDGSPVANAEPVRDRDVGFGPQGWLRGSQREEDDRWGMASSCCVPNGTAPPTQTMRRARCENGMRHTGPRQPCGHSWASLSSRVQRQKPDGKGQTGASHSMAFAARDQQLIRGQLRGVSSSRSGVSGLWRRVGRRCQPGSRHLHSCSALPGGLGWVRYYRLVAPSGICHMAGGRAATALMTHARWRIPPPRSLHPTDWARPGCKPRSGES